MNNQILSPDTQAILLLCAQLSKSSPPLKPLNLDEYNQLENWLTSKNQTPKDLFSLTSLSQRVSALLQRGVALGLLVEKWASQGIWILSRIEPEYPQRLLQQKQRAAPIILYGVGNQKLLSQNNIRLTSSIPHSLDQPTVSVLSNNLATSALVKQNRDYIRQGLLTLISATEP